MRAKLYDREDNNSFWNGMVLESPKQLRAVLGEVQLQSRAPFFAEIVADNGRRLLLGVGPLDGCVQFSSSSAGGAPPYLMAVGHRDSDGELVFMAGGTPTPVPRRFGLPMRIVTDIACFFMEAGERSLSIIWEEI